MRAARVLGAIGRFLISTGVVILLFTAYQLWGTGIQHARAQNALEDDFTELLEQAPEESTELGEDATEPTSDEVEAVSADGSGADLGDFDATYLELLYPTNGEVLGRIEIPRIGLEEFFVEGVGVADLRQGPGHYRDTPLPGQAGNAAIAGHRTTYGAPFHRVDELEIGDEIIVTTLQGQFTYRVTPQQSADGETKGHFIVSPGDTQVLDYFGDNRLTLTACHPKYSARQRIIVVAELINEPTETPPRPEQLAAQAELLASEDVGASPGSDVDAATTGGPDAALVSTPTDASFGEGLNGDRDAIPPAVAWGLAAIVLWVTAGWLGRRWGHRILAFAIVLIPVGMLWFMSFVHIDQAIPSY